MGEIWAAFGASTTLLAGLMIFLFTNLNTRLQHLETRMDALNARLDRAIEMISAHIREHH